MLVQLTNLRKFKQSRDSRGSSPRLDYWWVEEPRISGIACKLGKGVRGMQPVCIRPLVGWSLWWRNCPASVSKESGICSCMTRESRSTLMLPSGYRYRCAHHSITTRLAKHRSALLPEKAHLGAAKAVSLAFTSMSTLPSHFSVFPWVHYWYLFYS